MACKKRGEMCSVWNHKIYVYNNERVCHIVVGGGGGGGGGVGGYLTQHRIW